MAKRLAPARRGPAFLRPVVPREADVRVVEAIYREEILKPWRATFRRILSEYTVPDRGAFTDADGMELTWLVRQQQQAIDARLIYQTEALGRWVTGAATSHTRKLAASTLSATGVEVEPLMRVGDVRPRMEAAIRENVSLITNVNAAVRNRAEQILLNGFINRKPKSQVAAELQAALGITLRRAKTIARDQTEKLNADLTQIRSEQMGISHFRWLTRLDDRVRKTHEAREGRVYSWATGAPLPEKFPGVAINCRCLAEPVVEYSGSSWRKGGYRRRTRGDDKNTGD